MIVRDRAVKCPKCGEGRREFIERHNETADSVTLCCLRCCIVFYERFPRKKYQPKEERSGL